ncbi:MAG: threonine/serine dehydratase [Pseudomonadota bacterium]
MSLTAADIENAAARLHGHSVRTPLLRHPDLDARCDARIWLKPECLQRSGSFKFRGAFNALSRLSPTQQQRGVLAWSSGNHAQGIAAAAALLGIKATIVMPADAPQIKLMNTRALGAEVVCYDRYRESREAIGTNLAEQSGATIIAPYDNYDVMAGQGTCGLEIVQQLQSPPELAGQSAADATLDSLLICCGGGGLSAGITTAFAHYSPDTQLYAVEPEHYNDHARSLRSGRRESNPTELPPSICDALLAPAPGRLTFPINQTHLAGVLTVSDDMVKEAMRYAFRVLKLVVEPGGAVALAALLSQQVDVRDQRVGVIISGGNVDPELFANIISKY